MLRFLPNGQIQQNADGKGGLFRYDRKVTDGDATLRAVSDAIDNQPQHTLDLVRNQPFTP